MRVSLGFVCVFSASSVGQSSPFQSGQPICKKTEFSWKFGLLLVFAILGFGGSRNRVCMWCVCVSMVWIVRGIESSYAKTNIGT